eukprot:gene21456-27489_t
MGMLNGKLGSDASSIKLCLLEGKFPELRAAMLRNVKKAEDRAAAAQAAAAAATAIVQAGGESHAPKRRKTAVDDVTPIVTAQPAKEEVSAPSGEDESGDQMDVVDSEDTTKAGPLSVTKPSPVETAAQPLKSALKSSTSPAKRKLQFTGADGGVWDDEMHRTRMEDLRKGREKKEKKNEMKTAYMDAHEEEPTESGLHSEETGDEDQQLLTRNTHLNSVRAITVPLAKRPPILSIKPSNLIALPGPPPPVPAVQQSPLEFVIKRVTPSEYSREGGHVSLFAVDTMCSIVLRNKGEEATVVICPRLHTYNLRPGIVVGDDNVYLRHRGDHIEMSNGGNFNKQCLCSTEEHDQWTRATNLVEKNNLARKLFKADMVKIRPNHSALRPKDEPSVKFCVHRPEDLLNRSFRDGLFFPRLRTCSNNGPVWGCDVMVSSGGTETELVYQFDSVERTWKRLPNETKNPDTDGLRSFKKLYSPDFVKSGPLQYLKDEYVVQDSVDTVLAEMARCENEVRLCDCTAFVTCGSTSALRAAFIVAMSTPWLVGGLLLTKWQPFLEQVCTIMKSKEFAHKPLRCSQQEADCDGMSPMKRFYNAELST